MIQRKTRKPKKKVVQQKHYVIMNSDLKYFCGFHRGGKFRWADDFEAAKKFEDEHKFNSFKKWCNEEVIMDWID